MDAIIVLIIAFLGSCDGKPTDLQDGSNTLQKEVRFLIQQVNELRNEVSSLNEYCKIIPETVCGSCRCKDSNKIPSKYYCDCQDLTPARDCRAHYEKGARINGIYKIHQNNLNVIQVYCDQATDGGGWTVIQRRRDGSVNFYRDWFNYKVGFGDLTNEFWLGNEFLSTLSLQALYPKRSELRIDMETWSGSRKYAKYGEFQIGDEQTKYKVHVRGYSGNAGDSLLYLNGVPFSTYDHDNDLNSGNCAALFKGAWWYKTCHYSNLNGRYYYFNEMGGKATGIHWFPIYKHMDSLKFVEIKIRRN